MGGTESLGFLAPTGSGENELMRCENGDYFADIEAARGDPARAATSRTRLDAPEEIETPDVTTIEALAEFLGIDPAATSKAMPVVVGDRVVLALVRGDDRLSEEKLMTIFESAFRPATTRRSARPSARAAARSARSSVPVEVIADEALREGQFVAGANRDGRHVRGVEAGRDYEPRFADIRQATRATRAPSAAARLTVQPAIEVGHIFKLGTFHSNALEAMYLDEDGIEKTIVMGSYGIGPARLMAAIVEQHHDERGIVWPRSVAPYDVHIVCLPGLEEQAEALEQRLEAAGAAVLLDDRELRAGEKFADADLIGCPYRITVGKKTLEDGAVDVLVRQTGEESA